MALIQQRLRHLAAGLVAKGLIAAGAAERGRAQAFASGAITPLLFHNPRPALFRRCMAWLQQNGYTFISSDELLSILLGDTPAQRGAVWISFDDGWQANLRNAAPTLQESSIPATWFISTDPVARSGVFWWTLARRLRHLLPEPFRSDLTRLWRIPEAERRALLAELEARASPPAPREAMTVAEVQALAQFPNITIGSHTAHHAILPNCTLAELEAELSESQESLRAWTEQSVHYLAYPNGDYGEREEWAARRAGYTLAATTERRLARVGDDPMRVPRINLLDDITFAEAVANMSGAWAPFVARMKALAR